MDLRQLEFREKFAHDERALVLNQVLLYAFLLILACLVHQSEHRINAKLHGPRHVIAIRNFEESEFGISAGIEIDLAEVLVQEFKQDKDTVGVDKQS